MRNSDTPDSGETIFQSPLIVEAAERVGVVVGGRANHGIALDGEEPCRSRVRDQDVDAVAEPRPSPRDLPSV
jgi:hypothetical protein